MTQNETHPSEVRRSEILRPSNVEYANYAVNHVLGCAHGCKYPCYAFNRAKRFGKVKSYEEWRYPRIVSNTLELLDKELPKKKHKIESVHLCFTTDPFMVDQPDVVELTLAILERLNAAGVRAQTLTKGITSVVLANTEIYGTENFYGITLVSLDEAFRRRYEPYSAPFVARVAALRTLYDAGLKTWVSIEPYPTPNICEQRLDDVLEAVSFVDRIVFGRWNYNSVVNKFDGASSFYADCAAAVTDFCLTKGIDVHIKEGTS